jgi:hypothetical protein
MEAQLPEEARSQVQLGNEEIVGEAEAPLHLQWHSWRESDRSLVMNSRFGSGTARFRKILLVTALAAGALLTKQSALAQSMAIGSLTQTGTGLSTFSITSNQTFQLTLMINTNFISGGITYFLMVSNNGSGFFRITARDATLSPYPDPVQDDATVFGGNAALLNPVNDFDLGAYNTPGGGTDPAGNYTIGILTISALNVPPGQYTIFTDNRSTVLDRTGGGLGDVAVTGAIATINVIPEPNATGLAILGGAILIIVVWRNRRVRAS